MAKDKRYLLADRHYTRGRGRGHDPGDDDDYDDNDDDNAYAGYSDDPGRPRRVTSVRARRGYHRPALPKYYSDDDAVPSNKYAQADADARIRAVFERERLMKEKPTSGRPAPSPQVPRSIPIVPSPHPSLIRPRAYTENAGRDDGAIYPRVHNHAPPLGAPPPQVAGYRGAEHAARAAHARGDKVFYQRQVPDPVPVPFMHVDPPSDGEQIVDDDDSDGGGPRRRSVEYEGHDAVPRAGVRSSNQRQRPDPVRVPSMFALAPSGSGQSSSDDSDGGRPRRRRSRRRDGRATRRHSMLESLPSDGRAVRPQDSVSQVTRTAHPTSASQLSQPKSDFSSTARSPPSDSSLGYSAYFYKPLRGFEFRLVELLPARINEIRCRVRHESLQSPPPYIAISYSWGDSRDTTSLKLDDVEIPVAVSLHGALGAVRQRKESVLVWIDALCINQRDPTERTGQVRLMTEIYNKAKSVSVWLGPEADDSEKATEILKQVSALANQPDKLLDFLAFKASRQDLGTVVSLFEREYWSRLWVVQEIFYAREVTVYCGSTGLPWGIYKQAALAFNHHSAKVSYLFPSFASARERDRVTQSNFSFSQVLIYHGPTSLLLDINAISKLGDASLLEVMRACRRKLCSDPRDKVFGILGVLPKAIQDDFRVDYRLSTKEVYTDVVDILRYTTRRLDVICEAVHFPLHSNTAGLPSWVPDWSHVPDTTPIGLVGRFSACGNLTEAQCDFKDRRRKLVINAIEIGTVDSHGISLGTLCTLADYLMAFLHWRAMLLGEIHGDDSDASETDSEDEAKPESRVSVDEQNTFCRTLCLGQVPRRWSKGADVLTACYHVFASLTRERLPRLKLDARLRSYASRGADVGIKSSERRQLLQENFASHMMGRCFFLTRTGRMGLGSGFITVGDVVVVTPGCSTPIVLRPEGRSGEYRFVGDAYVDGYMYGRAVQKLDAGDARMEKYVVH